VADRESSLMSGFESAGAARDNKLEGNNSGGVQMSKPDHDRLDRVVAEARRSREQREQGYRERALKIYPWICGRCAREFTHENLQQLTVHHRDHNHDNNPPDGSNWELLCLYCHDNEHSRYLDSVGRVTSAEAAAPATHQPFADLKSRLKGRT
jgi:5-methylcytosine-specific restriction endonuclease McrA